MKKVIYVIGVFFVLAMVQASAQNKEAVAIVGGTIIDGNGGTPIENGVIVIEGKRIVAVGDRTTPIPQQASRISATGKFIIPGLMDGFMWLVQDYEPANTFIRYEGRLDEIAIEGAQLNLKYGVTTIFDVWGPRDDLIKARDAINRGQVIGSRIYLAGNIIGYGGPYSEDFSFGGFKDLHRAVSDAFTDRIDAKFVNNVGPELTWMSPEEVREEIRKYIKSGVNFLNVAATAHTFGDSDALLFSPRVLHTIVEEAHAAGLPVVQIKVDSSEALAMQLDAGVDALTSCPYGSGPVPYSAEMVRYIAHRQIPCMIPAFSKKFLDLQVALTSKLNVGWGHREQVANANTRALVQADAMIVMQTVDSLYGPDSLNGVRLKSNPPGGDTPRIVGDGHFHWLLNATQEYGMKPMAALMAATRNVARTYKVDKDLGTLEPGKLADLVILDRNPLEDPNNYRSISLVMKEGSIIDREALPTVKVLTPPPASPK